MKAKNLDDNDDLSILDVQTERTRLGLIYSTKATNSDGLSEKERRKI